MASAESQNEIEIIPIEGTHQRIGKIHQILNGTFNEIWNILIDAKNFPNTMPRNRETAVLEQKDGFIRYRTRLDMPWPVSDVEYDCDMMIDKENKRIDFRMVPGTGKNVKNFLGHWGLQVLSPNQVLAIHELMFEPETNYPEWVMNLGIKSTLGNVMKRIQSELDRLHNIK